MNFRPTFGFEIEKQNYSLDLPLKNLRDIPYDLIFTIQKPISHSLTKNKQKCNCHAKYDDKIYQTMHQLTESTWTERSDFFKPCIFEFKDILLIRDKIWFLPCPTSVLLSTYNLNRVSVHVSATNSHSLWCWWCYNVFQNTMALISI